MQSIDNELEYEVVNPPSKPRLQNKHCSSVWTKIHFTLLLPALRRLKQVYATTENDILKSYSFNQSELRSFVDILPDLEHALKRYNSIQGVYETMTDIIQSSFDDKSFHTNLSECHCDDNDTDSFDKQFIVAFHDQITHYKHHPEYSFWKFSSCLTTPEDLFHAILGSLPDAPSDLNPFFAHLLSLAVSENDILGRLFQTYYAVERKIPFKQMGIIEQAEFYYGTGLNLFQRTSHYLFHQIPTCPLKLLVSSIVSMLTIVNTISIAK
jgi:hypothetical protein